MSSSDQRIIFVSNAGFPYVAVTQWLLLNVENYRFSETLIWARLLEFSRRISSAKA